jgi:erythronate-4-phosphate dehydrogenase
MTLPGPGLTRAEGPGAFVELDKVFKEADIITLHVPLNLSGEDKTHHLANRDFFGQLAKKVFFINTSRGGVVDSGALKAALQGQKLAGAVLDVWEGEPGIDLELLDMARIGTTHIAGYSADGKAKGTSMSVQAVSMFFGLGLNDWYPDTIPAPEHPDITLDVTGLNMQEMLLEVVNQSYNVLEDDRRLREAPERFEELRGSYPLRREPGAFRVKIINDQAGVGTVLEKLGYQVINKRTDNN